MRSDRKSRQGVELLRLKCFEVFSIVQRKQRPEKMQRRSKFYDSIDELQADLDQWLHYYNYERPHQGYCNLGHRPANTLVQFVNVDPPPIKKET